jgi:MinD superfamily P-loop ATPase
VISGKGGTGKTVVTACFAALAENAVLADCDVDAPDLHLLLHPQIEERHPFKCGTTAVIEKERCVECGDCVAICRFHAITEDWEVDPISCEGCRVCAACCPAGAIRMEEDLAGEWFISQTRYGPLVHARLGIAQENSGKLVTQVRQTAKRIAEEKSRELVIVDGPPGIGCPVIACLADVDLAVIVTEPTLSGIHDMERMADVTRHFGAHTKVVINKYDINPENTESIRGICRRRDIGVLGELPFSEQVARSLVAGVPIVEFCDGPLADAIVSVWQAIKD